MDFLRARDGEHLMTPFECDLCIFRKLRKIDPRPDNSQDELLLVCIRRINLDAFWARASTTVNQNRRQVNASLKFSKLLGLPGSFEHKGPYPTHDHCGYEVACNMLLYSRNKGRHDPTHTQFATIRRLRSVYSNQCRAAPQANITHLSMVDTKGKYSRFATDKCGSLWFQRFIIGCENRMGVIWKPNLALSIPLLLAVLAEVEVRISDAVEDEDHNLWIVFSAYAVVSYVLSLRGNEGILLDLQGINEKWKSNDGTFILIALLGKMKGETLDRSHLIPCANVTSTGIKVKSIVRRLAKLKRSQNLVDGPAISDSSGNAISTLELDGLFVNILEHLYDSQPALFPANMEGKEHIRERYHCFRTWRKTSNTRALELGLKPDDINIVNKWDQVGNKEGKRPTGSMRQYYVQLELLFAPFLRYTRSM